MKEAKAITYAKKLACFRQETGIEPIDQKFLPNDRNFSYMVNIDGYSLPTHIDCIAEDTDVNDAIDMILYSAAQNIISRALERIQQSENIAVGSIGWSDSVSESAQYSINFSIAPGKTALLEIERLIECDNAGYAQVFLDGNLEAEILQDNSENLPVYIYVPPGDHEVIISIDGGHKIKTREYSLCHFTSTSLPIIGSIEYGIDFEAAFMQSPSKIGIAMVQACRLQMSLNHLNSNRINASQRSEEYKAVISSKISKDNNLFKIAVSHIAQLLISFENNFNSSNPTIS